MPGRVGRRHHRSFENTKAEWEAQANAVGVEVAAGVSKKVKLLVAGDPDSLSGKARRATELNIPIVHEAAFASMLTRQHYLERGTRPGSLSHV